MRAKFRKTIKENKKKSGELYVSLIINQTSQDNNNKTNVKKTKSIKKNEDNMVAKPKDIANILAEKFNLDSSNRNYSPNFN